MIGDTEKSSRRNYKNNFLNQKPSYDAMSLVIGKSNYIAAPMRVMRKKNLKIFLQRVVINRNGLNIKRSTKGFCFVLFFSRTATHKCNNIVSESE